MDYSKLAAVINQAVEEKLAEKAAFVRLGTVTSVSESIAMVTIDGSSQPAPMIRACSCAAGNRVVIIRQATQFYVLAKVGG